MRKPKFRVRRKKALILERVAKDHNGTYKQILHAHITKELTGEYLLPLPKAERPTYSATEIGEMLGITAHKVGFLSNANSLKTEEYGGWFMDKSPHSPKEVRTFRYFDSVLPVLRGLVTQ